MALEKLIQVLKMHQEDSDRLFKIIRGTFAYASPQSQMIEKALEIATAAHAHQKRGLGNEPYISHPRLLSGGILMEYLGSTDPIEIAGGLLHDTPEDCSEEWPIGRIHESLNREIAETADWCDMNRFCFIEDQEERERRFIENLLMVAPFRVIRIKCADMLHNAITPFRLDDDVWIARKVRSIREDYLPMSRKHGGVLQHELIDAADALERKECLLPPIPIPDC